MCTKDSYKILSNIIHLKVTLNMDEIIGSSVYILTSVTDLIFCIVRYLRKHGNTVGQYITYL
jgi:hypothetical protein